MPSFHNGTANEVDALKLDTFIRDVRSANPGAYFSVCIERVRAMPDRSSGVARKMGAQSSFNFGDGFGQLKAVFRALRLEPVLVEARSWKNYYGLPNDKEASRALAVKRFPSAATQLARKKDNGRAEALLIALYHDNTDHAGRNAA
jgi:crossover junction endodeoxyribonuclease RuvC